MDQAALTRNLRVYAPLALTPAVPWLGSWVSSGTSWGTGGIAPGMWLVPLLAPLTLYFAFRNRVRLKDYFGAWRLGIAWVALLSLGVVTLVLVRPEAAQGTVIHGEAYRQEMFDWIRTGAGSEGHPMRALPTYALHLVALVALTWVSAGYLGLVLGAVLTGAMSYFVGSYAAAAEAPWIGPLLAWVPWSVLRVMAFVLLGCLFARPLLVGRPWPFGSRENRLLLLAAGGILADVLLAALTADRYGVLLRRFADGLLS
jgi:hypothetical protein